MWRIWDIHSPDGSWNSPLGRGAMIRNRQGETRVRFKDEPEGKKEAAVGDQNPRGSGNT